jgi:HEAT repeat protein
MADGVPGCAAAPAPEPLVQPPRPTLEPTVSRDVAAWVMLLARTLKTCRLYDAANPTVVRFREDLAQEAGRLLERHGAITLEFTSTDVRMGEHSLYPARSREDNLAAPFFRDGVRSLTLAPGLPAAELDTLLDALLAVTAPGETDEDLVTRLWDAELTHATITHVPTDREIEGGASDEGHGEGAGAAMPWPSQAAENGARHAAGAAGTAADEAASRSDDWADAPQAAAPESLERALVEIGADEVTRFRAEFEAERARPLAPTALGVVLDGLGCEGSPTDRVDLTRVLPRVVHEALAAGDWGTARRALAELRTHDPLQADPEAFFRELADPRVHVTRRTVAEVDRADAAGLQAFLDFAAEAGEPAVDWLMQVLAESQQARVRRPLARVVARLTQGAPERLAPWLADGRWYVARNVVHILGWIGGEAITGLLRTAAAHAEPRVRLEVVAACAQVPPPAVRRLLLERMTDPDARVFRAVLHQLAAQPDPEVAERLVALLREPAFEERPSEEQHALFSALAATGRDEVLPALEAELMGGGWLARPSDARVRGVARCLARIGSPAALELLARGRASKRAAVRRACEAATPGGRA